ncbi:hypothetical protein WG909_05300 [Peptostreptococcaceae bacterium AGR-M142]
MKKFFLLSILIFSFSLTLSFAQDYSNIDIQLNKHTNEDTSVDVTLRAFKDNKELWVKAFPKFYLTELDQVSKTLTRKNNIYVIIGGTLYNIDITNGNILYKFEGCGASNSLILDDEDNIYFTGYYGPFLTCLDKEGNKKWQIDSMTDFYWPYEIFFDDDLVFVKCENNDENNPKNLLSFYKDSGKLNKSYKMTNYFSNASKLKFDNIFASSTLEANTTKYSVSNLIDNNNATAWVEGKMGYGINEYVEFSSIKPKYFQNIIIKPGYLKSYDTYNQNGIPRKIQIVIDDGKIQGRTISFPNTYFNDSILITFSKKVKANKVKFIIKDVIKGSKYEDTCISEISFY